MSDTVSLSSNMSGDVAIGGIVVEEVGQLAFPDFVPRRIVLLNYTLAALGDEGKLLLGEIRTRGGDDWTLAGRSVTRPAPEGDQRRYIDLALVPNVQHGQVGSSIIFLAEKKNKERVLTAHHVKHGKTLALDEEFTTYDKVNVLGKGVTHIAADINAPEPTIFSVSNLLRKLRLEDAGSTLKPTTARAQVPAEVQDGTMSMTVQPVGGGSARASSAATKSKQSSHHQSTVVVSFRTKSAGKNKFMIEWFQSNKKDELVCMKSPLKLGEDCEPTILLSDPRDTRTVYALCRNRANATTALYKLTRGRKPDEALITFNFEVELAAMGMSADQNVTLLLFDAARGLARIYTLQKTEGFRGRHPVCAHCPPLEAFSSPSHVLSCVTHRWQLPVGQVDQLLMPAGGRSYQMALVTLLEASGRYAVEPETGSPYRLRILGCDTQGYSPAAILLEDLDRTFENAEDKLASATLKICMNQTPCRDSLSQFSAWLMAGRIGSIEIHFVKTSSGSHIQESGSDRLVLKPLSDDRFRSYVTDMDWTQMNQRQGTFTLDQSDGAGMSASMMSTSSCSGGNKSRIPVARVSSAGLTPPTSMVMHSPAPAASSTPMATPINGRHDHGDYIGEEEVVHDDVGVDANVRSLVQELSSTLEVAVDDNGKLRARLASLQANMDELKTSLHLVDSQDNNSLAG